MSENERRLTDDSENINTISELPGKKFNVNTMIEIPLFIIIFSMALTGVATSNILLYRTCVHSLGHSESECRVFLSPDKTNVTQQLEKDVQKYSTFVSTVKSVIDSLIPAVLSLFLGVWSDIHGRKPLLVWPLFGIVASGLLLVVYSMMDNLGPWWYILTVIPHSLTGGLTVMLVGALCFVSDVTTTENRSIRMTILGAAASGGSLVGMLLSSFILRAVGNVYLLLIGASFNVFAYAYTNICIRESLTGAIQGGLNTVLDVLLVKEMLRDCFKRRPNNGRAQILLLTLVFCLTIMIAYGQTGLEYMYVRQKLQWALKDFTLYSAMNTIISYTGSFIGIMVVQKYLGINDLAFVNIAFVSTIAEFIIKALAVETWHMYLGAGVSMFKGLSSPLLRSFLTKILPLEDIAKVFALMSAIDGICPLIAPLMYNSLYMATLSTFPAAIFILSSVIIVISIVCVGFVQYYRRNVSTYDRIDIEPRI